MNARRRNSWKWRLATVLLRLRPRHDAAAPSCPVDLAAAPRGLRWTERLRDLFRPTWLRRGNPAEHDS